MRNKYLIALLPPEPFSGEIYKLKEHFRDQYQSKASLNSPAHITLHMPFEFDNEPKLLAKVNELSIQPFTIELKDFGCFEPRVIFIAVKESPALEVCHKRVVGFCKKELDVFNADYKNQPFHPHVTLAFRDLKRSLFPTAWREFKSKSYEATFECRHISVLKHDRKFWREFS
ncbi:MAG TPA: 2'-5' RNA ligase family protein [Cyclobacteriaceae bacterium]